MEELQEMSLKNSGLPQFIIKLYNILDDSRYSNYIRWSVDGKSFFILDPVEFTNFVLSEHFKHSNMSSFVRQLNKYDFHKVKSSESSKSSLGNNVWEFAHRHFRRDRYDLISQISRKKASSERIGTIDLMDKNGQPHPFEGYVLNSLSTSLKYFEMITSDLIDIKNILLNKNSTENIPVFKVLLAEDNSVCSSFASLIIKNLNMKVISVENINEFTYAYRKEKYDIILVSALIPQINELLLEIRAIKPNVLIVLIVDFSRKNEDIFLSFPTVNDVIYKPYSQEGLTSLLKAYESSFIQLSKEDPESGKRLKF
jgi:hypothetical protein